MPRLQTMLPLAALLVACQPTIGDAPPSLGGGSGVDAAPGGLPERPDAGVVDRADAGGLPGGDDDDGDDPGVQQVLLSQNTDDVILPGHSIGCVEQDGGRAVQNRENSYYRLFDLDDEGVDGDLEVTEVHVGIESAATPDDSAQPITVRLHEVNGDLRLSNMTELASTDVQVEPQTGTILDVPIDASVEAGSQLAVEVFVPNSTVGRLLFIGSNDAGQEAPSFIRAPLGNCAITEPTDFAEPPLNRPNVHIVLSVSGQTTE